MTPALRPLSLCLAVLLASPLVHGRALAQTAQVMPGGDDAEALMAEGIRLRKANDHAGALELFRRAYQLAPGPKSAAQLGLCEMAVAQFVEAEAHLGEALRSSDPWVNQHRAALYDAINATKNFLGTLEVLGRPEGAEVEVDGRTVGRLPLPRPLRMISGRDVYVRVSAPGHEPVRRAVRIEPRELTRAVIELDPIPAGSAAAPPGPRPLVPPPGPGGQPPPAYDDMVSPPHPAPSGTWMRPAGWLTAGVAVVLAGGGALMLVRSNEKVSAFNDVTNAPGTPDGRCSRGAPRSGGGECPKLLDEGESARKLAIGAFVGSGIAAAATIALFASAPERPRYALHCTPTAGLGAACAWRF
jgi:hypothetical protein